MAHVGTGTGDLSHSSRCFWLVPSEHPRAEAHRRVDPKIHFSPA
jgi:hypothetical protein